MWICNLFFGLFILLQPLHASENSLITFAELSQIPAESLPVNVQIRGFLYKAEDGRLILASEPNLKSCCVASPAKLSSQIIVQGAIAPPKYGQALLIKGTLVSQERIYYLQNAQEISW